jgi:hypothetical protein
MGMGRFGLCIDLYIRQTVLYLALRLYVSTLYIETLKTYPMASNLLNRGTT